MCDWGRRKGDANGKENYLDPIYFETKFTNKDDRNTPSLSSSSSFLFFSLIRPVYVFSLTFLTTNCHKAHAQRNAQHSSSVNGRSGDLSIHHEASRRTIK